MGRFKRRQCFKSKARDLPEILEFERIFYIVPGVHIANLHHPGAYRLFKQRRNLRGESRQQFRLQRRLNCKWHSGSHFVHGPLLNPARPPLRLSLMSAILILHSRRKNRNSERSISQAHRAILLSNGQKKKTNQSIGPDPTHTKMPPRKRPKLSSRATSSTPQVETTKQPTSANSTTDSAQKSDTEYDLVNDPWTDEQETALLKSIVRWKPVGISCLSYSSLVGNC